MAQRLKGTDTADLVDRLVEPAGVRSARLLPAMVSIPWCAGLVARKVRGRAPGDVKIRFRSYACQQKAEANCFGSVMGFEDSVGWFTSSMFLKCYEFHT